MLPLLTALAVLLLTALAEWLHVRRTQTVGRLAFGPAGRGRAWTALVPLVRPLAYAAFAWGLAVMVELHFAEQDGSKPSAKEPTRLIFVADLSPSMKLKDAGPDGKLTRQERIRESVASVQKHRDDEMVRLRQEAVDILNTIPESLRGDYSIDTIFPDAAPAPARRGRKPGRNQTVFLAGFAQRLPQFSCHIRRGEDLETVFTLAGEKDGKRRAAAVYALEEKLALQHWTKVQNRDPVKTYNKLTVAELEKSAARLAQTV